MVSEPVLYFEEVMGLNLWIMIVKIYLVKQSRINFILDEYISALVRPVDQSDGLAATLGVRLPDHDDMGLFP